MQDTWISTFHATIYLTALFWYKLGQVIQIDSLFYIQLPTTVNKVKKMCTLQLLSKRYSAKKLLIYLFKVPYWRSGGVTIHRSGLIHQFNN